ncbi:MAG: MFS transporter [Bacteroidia bacterium]|nr:MFS transporter [Bacteroidia bacterium]
MESERLSRNIIAIIIVAALGYFVDIYDLVLFAIVRVESLKAIGIAGKGLTDTGILLMDAQMIGLLCGGLLWGVLGDKRGRLSVLFGSIFLYSVANILNAFVQNVPQYAILRFIAGVGLAGELGAGITLIAEVMPKEHRGYGATIVATVGLLGAILAGYIGNNYDFRTCYVIGGVMGVILLLLRIGVTESNMFKKIHQHNTVQKGSIRLLFSNKDRVKRYITCILIGLPIWYAVGILVTLSPEFGHFMEIQGEVKTGTAIMYTYSGLALGDLICGLLSQFLKSRKKAVLLYMLLSVLTIAWFLTLRGVSSDAFYWMYFVIGLCAGYWAIFVTIASEQFGTNLRATVTTSVPNFVRGAVVPITLLFNLFRNTLQYDLVLSALGVAIVVFALSLWALSQMRETFGIDLNYLEGNDSALTVDKK